MGLRFGVILLAAGASSRMGRPKLLLPWGDATILAHLLGKWNNLGAAQICIVCSASNVELLAAIDKLGFPSQNLLFNPIPEAGMFASIQCAARWTGWQPDLTHWAISLGDQPQVKTDTLQSFLKFAFDNPDSICQPSRNGRPRHPVILPRRWFCELSNPQETTLKNFLQARESFRKLLPADDEGLDVDLDTPEDYQRAVRQFLATPRKSP